MLEILKSIGFVKQEAQPIQQVVKNEFELNFTQYYYYPNYIQYHYTIIISHIDHNKEYSLYKHTNNGELIYSYYKDTEDGIIGIMSEIFIKEFREIKLHHLLK